MKHHIQKAHVGDFPSGPVVKIHASNTGAQVQELRSFMLQLRPGIAKLTSMFFKKAHVGLFSLCKY